MITLKQLMMQTFGQVICILQVSVDMEHFDVSILDMAPEEMPLDQVVLGVRCDAHWLTERRRVPLLSSNTREQMDTVIEGGRLKASIGLIYRDGCNSMVHNHCRHFTGDPVSTSCIGHCIR